MLKVGSKAPDFTAPTDGGGKVSLKDFKGKTVVLYFYPKDNTSGCTAEACDFRDTTAQFKKKKAVVLGVSPDSVKSHDNFKSKFDLPFPLLADEDHKIAEKYGVWKEKSMYGRKYMGVDRSTFLIDAEGKVARAWRKVKVSGHAEEVLAAVRAL
jgi:peroxiredoxin Q/BCP